MAIAKVSVGALPPLTIRGADRANSDTLRSAAVPGIYPWMLLWAPDGDMAGTSSQASQDEWHSKRWKLQELKRHPKRPDELRVEQLQEPWDEGALSSALQVRGPLGDGIVDFDTSCAVQPPALFNKDPAFEKSIFIPGALAAWRYSARERAPCEARHRPCSCVTLPRRPRTDILRVFTSDQMAERT